MPRFPASTLTSHPAGTTAKATTYSSRVFAFALGILMILFPLPLPRLGKSRNGNSSIRPSLEIAKHRSVSISLTNTGDNTFAATGKDKYALPALFLLSMSANVPTKPYPASLAIRNFCDSLAIITCSNCSPATMLNRPVNGSPWLRAEGSV